jgi:hypothetical protein
MDPALYQQMVMASQQQHFYQGFAHPGQYHPAQQSMYSGVAFAQPGFPHPAYSPQVSLSVRLRLQRKCQKLKNLPSSLPFLSE